MRVITRKYGTTLLPPPNKKVVLDAYKEKWLGVGKYGFLMGWLHVLRGQVVQLVMWIFEVVQL